MAAQMSNFGRISRLFASKCRIRFPLASRKSDERWTKVYPCYVFSSSFHSTARFEASIAIKMPKLSPTMEEGTIVKWYKKEGDTITPGDVICDVETDKATVSMDLEEEGTLAKILFPENTKNIKIGKLIAVMVEEGDDWQNASIPADDGHGHELAEVQTQAPSVGGAAEQSHSNINDDGHLIGPAVKNLLEMYPIRIDDVSGSGRHGAVLKGDVLQTIKEKSLEPQPVREVTPAAKPAPTTPQKPARKAPPVPVRKGAPYADIELTGMRKTIAKRLTESKSTIPHAYSTIDCTVDDVMKLRKKLKGEDVKLSVNDFVIKAAATALRQVPGVNATLSGGESVVTLLPTVDISVAVATKNGLITPIVRNADLLGLVQISSTVKELSERARDGKLKPDEFIGGSFTISNLGMFGITEFTAVINPPQACILAVGTSQVLLGAQSEPRTVMRVTISSDSRVVDDSLAARFLSAFKQNLESPELMPIGGSSSDQSSSSDFLDLDAL